MTKKKKKKKFKISGILFLICLAIFLVSGYEVFTLYTTQKKEEDSFAELREATETVGVVGTAQVANTEGKQEVVEDQRSKYEILHEKNADYVAWIHIDNTHVDYPVMHTPNNIEYYLRRSFDGEWANAGTPFIGADCDLNSQVYIVYGQNMKNKTIFGDLDKYKDKTFWESTPEFTIETENEFRTYRIFANVVTDFSHADAFAYHTYVGDLSEEDFDKLIDWGINNSPYKTGERPSYEDQIVILSTCSYHDENGRFVIMGYRVD